MRSFPLSEPVMTPFRTLLAVLVILCCAGRVCASEVRIVVDTTAGTLTVLDGEEVIRVYRDISIGRYGVTSQKRQGDNKTPLGTFSIGWITSKTRYHRFLGLNYPDLETASRAFHKGIINKQQWLEIRRADKNGSKPPQFTVLGGLIGIHGIGTGAPEVHKDYNWTNGCVALTNEEIEELLEWVVVGTPVEIR
jgi:murein L,D-transpeptidase YafK